MKYLSVCSGIEAATVAWHPLGWSPVAFSEIEKFPCAVLKSHYPNVPNWGDMTKYQEWPDADVDLLVGGTPCQSFSVAGLRGGLADPRGNLALTYLGIVDRYRPEWMVWENVPGVLSSGGGRDFGSFLGGLAELGYGFAYRVLDAQFIRVDGFGRAVPQRRRRVFVVGNSRSWRRAAAVLFEPESLSGNSPPSRKAGKGFAATISARTKGGGGLGTDFELDGGLIASDIVGALNSAGGHAVPGNSVQDATVGMLIAYGGNNQSGRNVDAAGLNAKSAQRQDFESETFLVAPPIARTLTRGAESGGKGGYAGRRVRRLTPLECERLQGFPDGYTDVVYNRKNRTPDGPRYKALGNSMAVNSMRWLGRRIEMVTELLNTVQT